MRTRQRARRPAAAARAVSLEDDDDDDGTGAESLASLLAAKQRREAFEAIACTPLF